jgi:hypothetical protein
VFICFGLDHFIHVIKRHITSYHIYFLEYMQRIVCQGMDELLKKDVGQDSRFYAMGVSCGQAP